MTRLERVLIESFHRARWAESGGRPICPDCFDSRDVKPDRKNKAYRPNLRMYYCVCCQRRFTDLYQSPLHNTKALLLHWAIALLLPPVQKYDALPRRETGIPHANVTTMQAKLNGTPTASRWRTELLVAGITLARLLSRSLQRHQPSDDRRSRTRTTGLRRSAPGTARLRRTSSGPDLQRPARRGSEHGARNG